MQPQYDTKDVSILRGFYYDHGPEMGDMYHIEANDNKFTIIRVVKEFDFDGRRFWRLATVWHDGIPVMVIVLSFIIFDATNDILFLLHRPLRSNLQRREFGRTRPYFYA